MINKNFLFIIWTICFLELSPSNCVSVQNAAYTASAEAKAIDVNQLMRNAYRKAAIESGIDPDIVDEVLRTGKPSVKVENDENGGKRTTTVTLQPDGTISKHSRYEHKPTFVYTSLPSSSGNFDLTSLPLDKVPANEKRMHDWEWNPNSVRTVASEPSNAGRDFKWNSIDPYNRGPQPPRFGSNAGQGFPSNTDYTKKIETENTRTVTNTFTGPTEWRSRPLYHPWSESENQATSTVPPAVLTSHHYVNPNSLPRLDDFLKSQHATTTISPKENTHTLTPVTKINVQDLPIVKVLSNGEMVDFASPTSPQLRTETKSYSRTIQSNGVPGISDLDPDMKSILERAGIDPSEALASPDGTITKTRHEPGGKVITTKYRIRTMPAQTNTIAADASSLSTQFGENPQGPFLIAQPTTNSRDFFSRDERYEHVPFHVPSSAPIAPSYHDFRTTATSPANAQAVGSARNENSYIATTNNFHQNPIDEFLNKVDMNASGLAASNGEMVKTIIDDNGRVLTASFVLSTIRNNDNQTKDKQSAPIK